MNTTITCGTHRLSLDKPRIMGIINVTPDSFFSESRCATATEVLQKAEQMAVYATDIIDVGAYSTRPGAAEVSEDEEIRRLDMALAALTTHFPHIMLSVDTFRAGIVQRMAERYGAFIVNDVTGGETEPQLLSVTARLNLPYIAMHSRGNSQTMQQLTGYNDVVQEVIGYLKNKTAECRKLGIAQVIIDPGFGFAKTVAQNYELFNHIKDMATLDVPLLVGISRKTMIWKALGITPDTALTATSALHLQALLQGAHILRVHDVKEARQMVRLFGINACYSGTDKVKV
ncbi:MAG: dihydropteroate synthase [Prevotellaceae bacterium]|jgi:dihydropteroate synthase|nr:dihydropteroate synthase [Prevotellaceae bacterium]